MSQKNVEIVRRVYEGVTARMEVPRELFDPDSELDQMDVSPEDVGVNRGFEAAQKSLREYWAMFEDFHIEIEEVINADEQPVVTAVRDGGRIKGSDAEVSNRFLHVWTFGGGKIVRLSIHTDRGR